MCAVLLLHCAVLCSYVPSSSESVLQLHPLLLTLQLLILVVRVRKGRRQLPLSS